MMVFALIGILIGGVIGFFYYPILITLHTHYIYLLQFWLV